MPERDMPWREPPLGGGWSVRWLVIWLLFLAAVTLFPFDFQMTAADAEGVRAIVWNEWSRLPTSGEVVLNVLLFVPLGAWLCQGRARRSLDSRLVVVAATTGFLMSVSVESLQVFLPRRGSTLIDLVANTVGAATGAIAYQRWAAPYEAGVARLRAQRTPAALVVALVAYTSLALVVSGALQRHTRLSGWSDAYPLTIGNEQTGDRPWQGRVLSLELTDAATPAESVRRFSVGGSIVSPGARIAAFAFDGASPYVDATGNVPNLDWTDHHTEPHQEPAIGGVRLRGRPWLQTVGPAPRIAHRLGESKAFTLRVRCATDDMNQGGPARIVSNALDIGWRNFTLGQEGEDMVFRLRTPHTGFNGSRPQVVVPRVFADDQPHEILVTYDGAALRAAVADSGRVHRTEFTPGSSLAMGLTSLSIQADEIQTLEFIYLACMFVPPGVLIGILGSCGRGWQAVGAGWVLGFCVLFEGTLALVSGRPFGWGNVAEGAGVGLVVVMVVAGRYARGDTPMEPS